ncbi:acyltransferase [Porifericola rhodea]|uniref:acyltransferase n=1 Tax=Porifericola rhodea TaxID=930972 RepID=UPI0026668FB4|nr:acyltransferase [Porifericola rhodea]WKN31463.1 acyltransferase [Porifericola rhodea]
MANLQLRKHIKPTIKDKLRIWNIKKRLGRCGKGVFFEKNASFMRYPKLISIGDHVIVKEGAKICPCNEQSSVSIGDNTTIGYHTYIFASQQISIGNNCQIAPFVYLVDSDHGIAKDTLMNQQPNITAPIHIGNDVWIATGAKILKGVTIHDGAVIAAGAVVKEDVQPYEIVGGIPAKHISFRE